jgi:phosphopantothenoylcysteine decarboxylase/phosphopantothenate--cysteine ligase
MSKSKILFLITGSIACYKACHVISRLKQNDCEVQVVATPSALEFVGSATLEGLSGQAVVSDLFAEGRRMDHIHLMRWADAILVAPATANFINKASQGVADDLVQTLFLAHDFKKPFLLAPAMNTSMYLHPVTQKSIANLKQMGIQILETASGILACGEEGWGRLLDPDLIVKAALESIAATKANGDSHVVKSSKFELEKVKVLVTAGGTQEPIDTVRVLSNLSSGRTGIAIADFLGKMGVDVTLLLSHSSPRTSQIESCDVFTSFTSLDKKLISYLSREDFTHVIHTAAVSDYTVDRIEVDDKVYFPLDLKKMSSDAKTMSIHLKRNHKIVDRLKQYSKNKNLKVIAFKLTSHADLSEQKIAVDKLFQHSNADFVVHNDLTDIDILKNTHKFTFYSPKGAEPCESLERLQGELLKILLPEVTL